MKLERVEAGIQSQVFSFYLLYVMRSPMSASLSGFAARVPEVTSADA